MNDQPKIRVVVRKRPLTRKEQAHREQDIVEVRDGRTVIVREMKEKVDLTKFMDSHSFTFDNAFDQTADNSMIYAECVRPIVHSAFQGARVTCFAYGQTGSGKTYTMNGDPQRSVAGMYVLAAHDIFLIRQDPRYRDMQVAMSFYEIYCGKLFDLLNNREVLTVREDAKQNVNVINLTERRVQTEQEFMQIIAKGGAVRVTSQNSTNADSSRSHAILQISLLTGKKVHGKISFIDLAGCERGADTMEQSKQTRIDGAEINKSLLALKECIRALDNNKSHTPFRGSKLTMVLKDSFTGFCRTLMIGNISPNESACENTLNTLRYADRVKELRKGEGQTVSREDALARELMLPRMNKNKQTTYMSEDDESEDVQEKFAPPVHHRHSSLNVSQMEEERQGTYRGSLALKPHKNSSAVIEEEPENLNANRMMNRISLDNKINLPNPRQQQRQVLNQSLQNPGDMQRHAYRQPEQPPVVSHVPPTPPTNPPTNQPLSSQELQYWQQLFEEFRVWQPRTYREVVLMTDKLNEMTAFLKREEMELLLAHQAELQNSYDTFHSVLDMCNNAFHTTSKSYEEMGHYPSMIGPHIERKQSLVANLKSKLESFQHHYKDHGMCLQRLQYAQEHVSREEDDVSLLDEMREEEDLFFRNQGNFGGCQQNQQQPFYYNCQESTNGLFNQPTGAMYDASLHGQYNPQVNNRYSEPPNFMEGPPVPRQPTHNHNTRYSMNVNRAQAPFHGLFGQPAGRY